MRDLSRIADPARSGTVLARLSESSFAFVATRAGPSEGDDVSGTRDVLKRRHDDVRSRFNVVPPVRRVPRKKIDEGKRLVAEVRVARVRGVSCELTPMVFENIEMRNPAGFLLEDARHGYIQYISLSECYFAGKGAALVLPPNERARPSRRVSAAGCDIQQHLQSMFYLLRPEETLKMTAGDISDIRQKRIDAMYQMNLTVQPYIIVVGPTLAEISSFFVSVDKVLYNVTSAFKAIDTCFKIFHVLNVEYPVASDHIWLLIQRREIGVGASRKDAIISSSFPAREGKTPRRVVSSVSIATPGATVGLVLRVLADTAITLDGDGGFKVSVCGRQHIFKPVSVQAMWSALQTLHKVSGKAREQNYFLGGLSHDWVSYYEQRIESDRSCLNEWHAMDNLESKRPPSPDSVRTKPREREETERVIRSTLKEIMMSVDLDEVTSKYIRGRLEEDLDMDLGEFKPFIDQEMLTILGQMDAPTEIFDHVYLGSEWNASNLEELQKNGVRHILNVTREIDNFFPGMFTYLNVRVYDDEKTDLLKHWDNTFKYITKAKMEGSKVLVHCKMGVSRSASVVIAYAMKAYNWDFSQAWKHVKEKRNCIKPNNSFLLQLETYQGILDAMKNKEKLQRSKSDTNLKSPTSAKDQSKKEEKSDNTESNMREISGSELKKTNQRPKSWSPNVKVAENMLPSVPLSQSLESIDKAGNTEITREDLLRGSNQKPAIEQEARNVLMPCDNGQSYSVSQNKIMHLPAPTPGTPSVKNRISKLETQGQKRKGLVLNLTNQFEAASSKPSSPGSDTDVRSLSQSSVAEDNAKPIENGHSHCEQSQEMQNTAVSVSSSLSGKEIWDPGEEQRERRKETSLESTETNDNSECLVWTASANATCTNLCDDNKTDKGVSVESECITTMTADTTITTTTMMTTTMTMTTTTTTTTTTSVSTCHDVLGKKAKKEGDPFSAQLDRVFEREERRGEPVTRESPSRQSSWSSYDSAVVLDNNSVHSSWATLPSRNSSWGSYDMRPSDLLGSSGLFPYDKEEIPWHPGTVKRTKQKLEEGTTAGEVKRVCTQNSTTTDDKNDRLITEVDTVAVETYNPMLLHHMPSPTPRRRDSSPTQEHNLKVETNRDSPSPVGSIDISLTSMRQIGRLSTSAPAPSSLSSESDLPLSLRSCRSESETSSPCVVNTTQCPSVKHHKMVLENLCNKSVFSKRCLSVDDSPEAECPRSTSGIVKNLKKEFEAKSTKLERSPENACEGENASLTARPKRDVKIRSLPSSPVIPHNESKIQSSSSVGETKDNKHGRRSETTPPSSQENVEDLSVRVLVGKYEVARPESRKSSDVQLRAHKDKDWDAMEVHPPAKSKIAPEFSRRSAPIMINNHSASLFNETPEAPGRPPAVPSPSVVMASVVAKAASKKQQQHGRTHPLARLQVRPRHSSPVYNTM